MLEISELDQERQRVRYFLESSTAQAQDDLGVPTMHHLTPADINTLRMWEVQDSFHYSFGVNVPEHLEA